MKLIIEDDEGRKTVVPVVREEITIGRQDGNTIRLTERNVSRRHARLFRENGNLLVEDLGSYNGVHVNGEKITEKTRIKEGDLVEIGDYDLGIQGKFEATPTPTATPRATVPPGSMRTPARPAAQQTTPSAPQTAVPAPAPAAPSASVAGATAIIRVSDIMKAAPQAGEVRDLQRPEMPRLVGLSGPVRGKEFYLMRTEVKFGRTGENDVSLDHQSVSRQHCRFVLDEGSWKVIDNNSANGVRVNGDEYAVSNLNPGDTLELGHLKFRFCGPGEKFTLPPEKTDEAAARGPRPTAAELIAGAQQGRGVPAPRKKGVKGALVGGLLGAVVVLGAAAFIVVGHREKSTNENGEPIGEAAVKAGDALFKQHRYRAALEKYELAGEAPVPNRARATAEARGEDAYASLKDALQVGDGDKAKTLYDKCSSESAFWCQKVLEMSEPVKAAYAKKHLTAANAAKTAGKAEACRTEVASVLAFDSANAEAQALQPQCAPQETAKAEPPPRHEGPSPREREAKAARLAKASIDKLMGRDFQGAVKEAQAALAQNPSEKTTLGLAYKSLGYGYAYLNDRATAKKWLKSYRPYCSNDCAQVDAFLGAP